MQHVLICGTLYERMGMRAGATEAERGMFIEAVCAGRRPATCSVGPWRKGSAKVTHKQSMCMRVHVECK